MLLSGDDECGYSNMEYLQGWWPLYVYLGLSGALATAGLPGCFYAMTNSQVQGTVKHKSCMQDEGLSQWIEYSTGSHDSGNDMLIEEVVVISTFPLP